MAKKKIQLADLKVKSFVTTLQQHERKTAKGGYVKVIGQVQIDFRHGNFTDHKSQLYPIEPHNLVNKPVAFIKNTLD